ncbi:MAG: ribbon-helix-helix domain-containing protein [Terracidiphilus sp.]|nr:ribbon-helix-helix domain-containing protein [Terracidiphilus sp.]
MASPAVSRKTAPKRTATKPKTTAKLAKERVLIEFPAEALRHADEAARAAGVSRSEFIRSAVEQRIEALAEAEFERELAAACIANNKRNLDLLKEFEHVDREAGRMIP